MARHRKMMPLSEKPKCGAPCPGAGTLAWRDAEATYDAYRAQVTRWVDETILTMGLPHVDHLGRRSKRGAEEGYDEQAAWGVRRQLRDPGTTLIPEIVLAVQAEFFAGVRAGRACLFHLRGLMFTITQWTTWKMATKRALELMRERLLYKGETPPEDSGPTGGGGAAGALSPEEILLGAEQWLVDQRVLSVIEPEILRLSQKKAAIFRARMQDPPRSYEEIASKLGMTSEACRKHFCEARARVLRAIKPDQ
jgi:hypothetical protein